MKHDIIRPPEEDSHAVLTWQLRESQKISQTACIQIGWGGALSAGLGFSWEALERLLIKGKAWRAGQGRERACWGRGSMIVSAASSGRGAGNIRGLSTQRLAGSFLTLPHECGDILWEKSTSYSRVASFMIHLVKWIGLHSFHSWTQMRVVCTCVYLIGHVGHWAFILLLRPSSGKSTGRCRNEE